jgi:hypothetical protein
MLVDLMDQLVALLAVSLVVMKVVVMVSMMVVRKECSMVLMTAALLDDSWAGTTVVMKVSLMVGKMVS